MNVEPFNFKNTDDLLDNYSLVCGDYFEEAREMYEALDPEIKEAFDKNEWIDSTEGEFWDLENYVFFKLDIKPLVFRKEETNEYIIGYRKKIKH